MSINKYTDWMTPVHVEVPLTPLYSGHMRIDPKWRGKGLLNEALGRPVKFGVGHYGDPFHPDYDPHWLRDGRVEPVQAGADLAHTDVCCIAGVLATLTQQAVAVCPEASRGEVAKALADLGVEEAAGRAPHGTTDSAAKLIKQIAADGYVVLPRPHADAVVALVPALEHHATLEQHPGAPHIAEHRRVVLHDFTDPIRHPVRAVRRWMKKPAPAVAAGAAGSSTGAVLGATLGAAAGLGLAYLLYRYGWPKLAFAQAAITLLGVGTHVATSVAGDDSPLENDIRVNKKWAIYGNAGWSAP